LKTEFLSQNKTQSVSIKNINYLLMLFKEIIAVYSKNHKKPTKTLGGQNAELMNVKAGTA
jgi:aminoglycoside N3'-acetyltransferase